MKEGYNPLTASHLVHDGTVLKTTPLFASRSGQLSTLFNARSKSRAVEPQTSAPSWQTWLCCGCPGANWPLLSMCVRMPCPVVLDLRTARIIGQLERHSVGAFVASPGFFQSRFEFSRLYKGAPNSHEFVEHKSASIRIFPTCRPSQSLHLLLIEALFTCSECSDNQEPAVEKKNRSSADPPGKTKSGMFTICSFPLLTRCPPPHPEPTILDKFEERPLLYVPVCCRSSAVSCRCRVPVVVDRTQNSS